MYYDKIRHRHSQVLAATGLTPVEFDALLVTFKYHWDDYYSHFTLEGKVRQRISYNRKTSVLPLIQDKMFFILVYLKTNPLQELHAIQFEMTQPQANRWIHLLSEILRRTLKTLDELPDRNSKRLMHILQGCEEVLLDEPSDLFNALWMKTGSLHVIVVKKTHSIKNNLLCTNNLRIVWLSSTYEGHVHDKKICDEEPLLLPRGIRLWQDTGFIGHRPDGVEICMPRKKPKGKELTAVEKQENKRISGIRIKVEHAIGGMKKCRIVKERFRCHKFGFEDMVILIACGLHNFRISHKIHESYNKLIYIMSNT